MAKFAFRHLDSMADLDRAAWKRLYQEETEAFDYFVACEQAPPPTFKYSAIGVFDGDTLIAGAPIFYTTFNPGLVLDGAAKSAFGLASKALPVITRVPTVGFGSPHSQESILAFDTRLTIAERQAALSALIDGIEAFASQNKARVVLFKDIDDDMASWAHGTLQSAGFARAIALPVASLPVPESEEEYFSSLSGNMRSNLRRRLKRARNVRVEIYNDANGIAEVLYKLRKTTMHRASVDYAQFAETSTDFYQNVLDGMSDNACLLTYWLDDKLIGFAMVLLGKNKLVQNYNGMSYPEGPDNGVFYLDWMTQLRLCLRHGISEMQSGVTTYLIKARLGSKFHRSYLYVKHRYSAVNAIVNRVVPTVNLELGDPGLIELGTSAPFIEAAALSE